MAAKRQEDMTGSTGPTDAQLLRWTRDGDRDAFDAFYRRYREGLLGFLARRVRQPDIAADLMAEAFASMLVLTVSERDLPNRPAAWLFTTAKNLLVDAQRRGRVEADARHQLGLGVLELDDEDIERVLEIAEATALWNGLKTEMSDDEVEALNARIVHERPYSEIASELNCSNAVARQRVSRALRHLRIAMGGRHA